jgi:membrane protein implicated in regulation of membrane protease activity
VVTTAIPGGGEGMIRVHGELWRAVAKENLQEATRVRVRRVNGLKLEVDPATAGVSAVESDVSK